MTVKIPIHIKFLLFKSIGIMLILLCAFSCKEINEPTDNNDFVKKVYPQLDTEHSRCFFFLSACRSFGMAKKLGKNDDYNYFLKRSKNYQNLFNKNIGWIVPKIVNGKWQPNFDPYKYGNGFVKSNAAQATWFVPQDIEGLATLMGDEEKAAEKLNRQFEEAEKLAFTSGDSHEAELHPEYSQIPINYGYQPSIQTAFIFNQLNRPDLTQYWSRKVVKKVFSGLSTSEGYNGDEDQGLMGSLSVLVKIGLFQMNGGTEENPAYQIGSSGFDKITISLNPKYYPGKTFEKTRENNAPENVLVEKVLLNNKPVYNYEITQQDIANGGKLLLKI